MRLSFAAAMLVALSVPAHSECLPSADAVRNAHPGSYPKWRLQLPGHTREKCWYPASKNKAIQADAPKDAGGEITPVSAIAVPLPPPRSQKAPAETEREPLPAVATPAPGSEARSILIWG